MSTRANLAAALCEVCCRARTVKFSRASTFTPRGYDYRDGTCDLKCSACGRITRHALVLPDAEAGGRYEAQEIHEARPVAAADPFAVVKVLGVRVYEVADLEPDVVYVEGQSLGFIRAGLSPSGRRWVADWLLREGVEGGAR